MPDQDPSSLPDRLLPLNLRLLVDCAGVMHIEASEGVMEDILGVGISQLFSHESKESGEVKLSGTHFGHFGAEFVVLHDS